MKKPASRIELVVATKNKKKLQEIKDILVRLPVMVTSIADYAGAPRIVENGTTFKQNAAIKARRIARFTGTLTLGEDSGLCVHALHGAPGVKSARFSGNNKSDDLNNRKLITVLSGVPLSKRKAYYACAVALADKKGLLGVVEGRCSGVIGYEPKGSSGFGYDPLFIIPKYKRTFAQLGERVKHRMSHRYHALMKARKIIVKYIEHCVRS